MAHVRQSRPDFGVGFQVEVPTTFEFVPLRSFEFVPLRPLSLFLFSLSSHLSLSLSLYLYIYIYIYISRWTTKLLWEE